MQRRAGQPCGRVARSVANKGERSVGDAYPTVKVAAVQAASVFLDRAGSTQKACGLIREAGRNGARLIAFPEGFIPAHPSWYHFHPATGALAYRLAAELFKNAVEIPGPEIEALCAAAREAGAYVVVGVCEKRPRTLGTMFNTQVFIGPDGALLGKHQKLLPTVGERLVHMGGFGDTLGAVATEFGPVSGLICGENSNPLAIFALAAEGTRIHAMSWPNHFSTSSCDMPDRVSVDSRAFAQMTQAFVVSACGVVDQDYIDAVQPDAAGEEFLRKPACCGGSVIVRPDSRVLAGPLGREEGILYADCDLAFGIQAKIRHDYAGHYNRPDVFQLQVNRASPQLYAVCGAEQRAEPPGLQAPSPSLGAPTIGAPTLDAPVQRSEIGSERVPAQLSAPGGTTTRS